MNRPSMKALFTAIEMAEKLKFLVSSIRLEELAESQLIPHYVIEGKILFKFTEATNWIYNNLCLHYKGRHVGNSIATIINVVSPALKDIKVPTELKAIANLLIPLAIESVVSPAIIGVYFLCHESKVVYVGQSSRGVNQRIGEHFGNKTFDFAFFVRIPKSDLNFVEGELIRTLKPKYNWTKDNKRLVSPVNWVHNGTWMTKLDYESKLAYESHELVQAITLAAGRPTS